MSNVFICTLALVMLIGMPTVLIFYSILGLYEFLELIKLNNLSVFKIVFISTLVVGFCFYTISFCTEIIMNVVSVFSHRL